MSEPVTYSGWGRYYPGARDELGRETLLTVSCRIENLPDEVFALLDTASSWCVLHRETIEALGCEAIPGEPLVRLSTRLGSFSGWLDRYTLCFKADRGESLQIDATWFVCVDWPGPMVIGWKGGLERLRFGLDPATERFYFGWL